MLREQVLNIMGQKVVHLDQAVLKPAGAYNQQFHFKEYMEEGVYFLVLSTKEQTVTKQLGTVVKCVGN